MMNSWYLENVAGFKIYRCEEFNNTKVIQAFSTKDFGNMGLHTGDLPEKVIENRRFFLNTLGLDLKNLVAAQQVHGTVVRTIDKKQIGAGAFSFQEAIEGTDALITRERGVILSIFTADCLPIFIYDAGTPAIGIIHAGWRGTIAGIVKLTIDQMIQEYKTDPSDCRIAFGPSICFKCFTVAADVAAEFQTVDSEVVSKVNGRFQVDLIAFNMHLLQKIGVSTEQILAANYCTGCQRKKFFSYRAEGGTIGRMMGIIALK